MHHDSRLLQSIGMKHQGQSGYFQTGLMRLLSKLTSGDEVPGTFGAPWLSLYLILDDARTKATQQCSSEVVFKKKSIA